MAVNQIKTRILNKYDLLANYSTFKPLKGEICIAEVATVQKPNEIAAGFDGQTYDERPIVGIKVGDGQHTFAELPWVQAAAGDVTARMKEFTGEADIDAAIANLTSGRKLATVDELKALSEEFASVKATVNHAEHGNTALKSAIDTLSSDKVNNSVAETATATDKLVKETTVDKKITTAKGELNLVIQDVQTNLNNLETNKVNKNTEAISGINANIGDTEKFTGDDISSAIKALQDSVGSSSEDLGAQVSALKETVGDATKGLVKDVADLKQADTNMSNRVDGIEGRVKANEDKLAGIDGTVADSISAVNATATDALGKATTLIGSDSDAGKSVRKIANEELAAQLLSGDADADFKTLQELADWIEDHPENASAMNTAINSMKQNLGYTGETAPDTVDKRIADAISALETKINITNYVDKTTHKEATDAIAGLTAKVDTGDKNVSEYVEDYVAAELAEYANSGALHSVEARVEAIEKAPYATESYADGKASAAQTAAENTAKAGLDKLAGYTVGDTAEYTVKANAEGIASLNTTVKALVENDGNDGIVSAVTQNAETGKISVAHKKITMDEMDENEVFVFYCGNASGYDANFQVTL